MENRSFSRHPAILPRMAADLERSAGGPETGLVEVLPRTVALPPTTATIGSRGSRGEPEGGSWLDGDGTGATGRSPSPPAPVRFAFPLRPP